MNEIDEIFRKLDSDVVSPQEILQEISTVINYCLVKTRHSLGYWEKFHFASAIAVLAWNLNSSSQPTTTWLRLSLVNIEKALVPENKRDENYTRKDNQVEALTYEQLMDALNQVMKCS